MSRLRTRVSSSKFEERSGRKTFLDWFAALGAGDLAEFGFLPPT
jgi:hypothetical protein